MSDVATQLKLDPNEGRVVIRRVQDIEPILDVNKALQNEAQKWAGDFHHIGTIPNVILEKWMNEEGANVLKMGSDEFGQFIKRKLRDPDNMWLRTTSRRL
jgi:hypothetical protein